MDLVLSRLRDGFEFSMFCIWTNVCLGKGYLLPLGVTGKGLNICARNKNRLEDLESQLSPSCPTVQMRCALQLRIQFGFRFTVGSPSLWPGTVCRIKISFAQWINLLIGTLMG